MNDTPVRDAQAVEINKLLVRLKMANSLWCSPTKETSIEHLIWMLEMALKRNYEVPVDKTGRWLGYVQGVLAVAGILDVEDTRNDSRTVYHEAYNAMGFDIPETVERISD